MCGTTNKSPIKLSMQQKISWHGDLFTNRENLHGKNPPASDFNVTTPKDPLLSKQAVTRNPSTLYQPTVEPLS